MYLIVIAWIYVVLMMSVAEATNSSGTLLGAVITFVLYGLAPAALVAYLMGSPARYRAIKKRNAEELARHVASQTPAAASHLPSSSPDGSSEEPRGAVIGDDVVDGGSAAPVRKAP
jgi:adenine/guanine phosphoribosyltransferase-like PRPP-binding protein